MFKFNKKTEYGILALQHMLSLKQDQVATVKEIAENYKIPQSLLAKILQQLSRKKIIQSVQGAKGGYVLKTDADDLSLARVLEAIEGPIHITDCYAEVSCCDRMDDCTLRDGFHSVQKQIVNYLNTVRLADIAAA